MKTYRLHLVLLIVLNSPHHYLSETFSEMMEGVEMTNSLIEKLFPLPTVPTDDQGSVDPSSSRHHHSHPHHHHHSTKRHRKLKRVGAQRFNQFGTRCFHLESCDDCVCCGSCHNSTFLCHSPPGSIDYCRFYEYITLYTDIEKRRAMKTKSYALPDDFPDV